MTVQPVGGVAVSFTAVRSARAGVLDDELEGMAPPAVPSAFRRWSGVVRVIWYEPMIATCRGASTSWPPSVALTTMGYEPAGTVVGGVAVTVIVDDELALTGDARGLRLARRAGGTCQPSGPLADTANVRSSGVSLVSVRVKVNVVARRAAQRREVGGHAHLAAGCRVHLDLEGELRVPSGPDAPTSTGNVPGWAVAGTSTSSVAWPAADPVPAVTDVIS